METDSLKDGSNPGFLKKSRELDFLRDQKIRAAEKWKEYEIQNINCLYHAEKKQAEDEFKADVFDLRERLLQNLSEKKKKLQDDRSTLTLSVGGPPGNVSDQQPTRSVMTRTLRKRGGGMIGGIGKEGKLVDGHAAYKRRLNPPHIEYSLKESEILEDISLIQKAVSSHPAAFGRYDRGKSAEVFVARGRLSFHGEVFEKGQDVFVEAKAESGKWHGTLCGVNPSEIYIRSLDGTKSRFSLPHLRNGKYNIISVPTSS